MDSYLPPLRKWILSNKYFIKSSETKEKKSGSTHYLLDGGIWKVPMEKYTEFLKLLSVDLQNGEKYYISENRSKVFKLICDLDFFDDSAITIKQIERVVLLIQNIIHEYFGEKSVIICGTDPKTKVIENEEYIKSGFHLVWPKIWVTSDVAKEIRLKFIEILRETLGQRESINTWEDVVDLAVYEDNGLRMIGCRKMGFCECKGKNTECSSCNGRGKVDEGRVYKPISIIPSNDEYLKTISNDWYILLLETSIMNYASLDETKLLKDLPLNKKKSRSRDSSNPGSLDPISVKIETLIRKAFKTNYSAIRVKKVEAQGPNNYFVTTNENFCPNVKRNHASSTIYFQIKPTGICQRCFCKKYNCRDYSSPEVPITQVLQKILFNKKQIINYSIDSKNVSLNNCKSILAFLENELLK